VGIPSHQSVLSLAITPQVGAMSTGDGHGHNAREEMASTLLPGLLASDGQIPIAVGIYIAILALLAIRFEL